MSDRLATSLPGGSPAGIVVTRPMVPFVEPGDGEIGHPVAYEQRIFHFHGPGPAFFILTFYRFHDAEEGLFHLRLFDDTGMQHGPVAEV